jgi:hypothetical protein
MGGCATYFRSHHSKFSVRLKAKVWIRNWEKVKWEKESGRKGKDNLKWRQMWILSCTGTGSYQIVSAPTCGHHRVDKMIDR